MSGLVGLSWHHSVPFNRYELMLSQLIFQFVFSFPIVIIEWAILWDSWDDFFVFFYADVDLQG